MLLLLTVLQPADAANEAQKSARAAEVIRLRDEMERLAARGVWVGVERAYEQMERSEVELRSADHVLAAQAAMTLGDVGSARERIEHALAVVADDHLAGWRDEIDARFVHVQLEGPDLELVRGMTRPDALAAYRFAQTELARTGVFDGMLSYGVYEVGGRTLVLAGPGELNGSE
ncbi:MAG: hypothetical protein KC621_03910 [Myxococcales bacterium]|nr:hypothetical protein [Myxococcales bacterium]